MPNCGRCHKCGSPIRIVCDGEEWCDNCRDYQRPRPHGWAAGLGSPEEDISCEAVALREEFVYPKVQPKKWQGDQGGGSL